MAVWNGKEWVNTITNISPIESKPAIELAGEPIPMNELSRESPVSYNGLPVSEVKRTNKRKGE